jgi:hypothetical protein
MPASFESARNYRIPDNSPLIEKIALHLLPLFDYPTLAGALALIFEKSSLLCFFVLTRVGGSFLFVLIRGFPSLRSLTFIP